MTGSEAGATVTPDTAANTQPEDRSAAGRRGDLVDGDEGSATGSRTDR